MRHGLRWFLTGLLLVAGMLPGAQRGAARLPAVGAVSAIVIEAKSGRVLFAKEPDLRLPPASTTKIMTGWLLVRTLPPDAIITATPTAAATPGNSLGMKAGETFSARDLLYAILLISANDASEAVAARAGGAARFVNRMNAEALRVGAKNTHFANPHGLSAPDHYSTARDLATLARSALTDPAFNAAVRTKSYLLHRDHGRPPTPLVNDNRLLWTVPGMDGVKTGYTDAAGRCFVGAATRGGRRIITVVLHSPDWQADARTLIEYGFAHPAEVAAKTGAGTPAAGSSGPKPPRGRAGLNKNNSLRVHPTRPSTVGKTAPRASAHPQVSGNTPPRVSTYPRFRGNAPVNTGASPRIGGQGAASPRIGGQGANSPGIGDRRSHRGANSPQSLGQSGDAGGVNSPKSGDRLSREGDREGTKTQLEGPGGKSLSSPQQGAGPGGKFGRAADQSAPQQAPATRAPAGDGDLWSKLRNGVGGLLGNHPDRAEDGRPSAAIGGGADASQGKYNTLQDLYRGSRAGSSGANKGRTAERLPGVAGKMRDQGGLSGVEGEQRTHPQRQNETAPLRSSRQDHAADTDPLLARLRLSGAWWWWLLIVLAILALYAIMKRMGFTMKLPGLDFSWLKFPGRKKRRREPAFSDDYISDGFGEAVAPMRRTTTAPDIPPFAYDAPDLVRREGALWLDSILETPARLFEPAVRRQVRALIEADPLGCAPKLVPLLSHNGHKMRMVAADLMATTTPRRSEETLTSLIEDEKTPPEVRAETIQVLAELGGDRYERLWTQLLLRDGSVAAARALATLPRLDETTSAALKHVLQTPRNETGVNEANLKQGMRDAQIACVLGSHELISPAEAKTPIRALPANHRDNILTSCLRGASSQWAVEQLVDTVLYGHAYPALQALTDCDPMQVEEIVDQRYGGLDGGARTRAMILRWLISGQGEIEPIQKLADAGNELATGALQLGKTHLWDPERSSPDALLAAAQILSLRLGFSQHEQDQISQAFRKSAVGANGGAFTNLPPELASMSKAYSHPHVYEAVQASMHSEEGLNLLMSSLARQPEKEKYLPEMAFWSDKVGRDTRLTLTNALAVSEAVSTRSVLAARVRDASPAIRAAALRALRRLPATTPAMSADIAEAVSPSEAAPSETTELSEAIEPLATTEPLESEAVLPSPDLEQPESKVVLRTTGAEQPEETASAPSPDAEPPSELDHAA